MISFIYIFVHFAVISLTAQHLHGRSLENTGMAKRLTIGTEKNRGEKQQKKTEVWSCARELWGRQEERRPNYFNLG